MEDGNDSDGSSTIFDGSRHMNPTTVGISPGTFIINIPHGDGAKHQSESPPLREPPRVQKRSPLHTGARQGAKKGSSGELSELQRVKRALVKEQQNTKAMEKELELRKQQVETSGSDAAATLAKSIIKQTKAREVCF